MDRLTKKERSRLMSKIRSVSQMEVVARPRAVKLAGCRLRHQPKNIPGRPDYGNKAKKVAVYVNGCFWHACFRHRSMPKTNRAFWRAKFSRNMQRQSEVKRMLRRLGYRMLVVWEHDIIR